MVRVDMVNFTSENVSERNRTFPAGSGTGMQVELRIALYVAIFVLSVSGNALVALTIAQNRRMRTLTNVLLMNLSVADLLLAVVCMPFTLIPTLLQNFIFGPVVCVLVRYMQGAPRRHTSSFTYLFYFFIYLIIYIAKKKYNIKRETQLNNIGLLHVIVFFFCS